VRSVHDIVVSVSSPGRMRVDGGFETAQDPKFSPNIASQRGLHEPCLPLHCSCFWFCAAGLPNVNALDELEPPVPADPKALGVAFTGLPNTDWLESPLVANAEG